MPIGERPIVQTSDGGRDDLLHMRLYAFRTPDLKTTRRVFSCGLEFARIVERARKSSASSYHERGIFLFLRQRVNSFGNLHRGGELLVDEGIAPLTYQCQIQK